METFSSPSIHLILHVVFLLPSKTSTRPSHPKNFLSLYWWMSYILYSYILSHIQTSLVCKNSTFVFFKHFKCISYYFHSLHLQTVCTSSQINITELWFVHSMLFHYTWNILLPSKILGSPSPMYSILKWHICFGSSYHYHLARFEILVAFMIESRLVESQGVSTSNYFTRQHGVMSHKT
jgi:hypothetical protein